MVSLDEWCYIESLKSGLGLIAYGNKQFRLKDFYFLLEEGAISLKFHFNYSIIHFPLYLGDIGDMGISKPIFLQRPV